MIVGSVPSTANTSFTISANTGVPELPPGSVGSVGSVGSPAVNSTLKPVMSMPLSLMILGSKPGVFDEPNASVDEPIANIPKLNEAGAKSLDVCVPPAKSAVISSVPAAERVTVRTNVYSVFASIV